MDLVKRDIVRRIADNGIVAALYYALTLLFTFVPVLSQFGPIQCRFSEALVLLAFFRPDMTFGLGLGCFLANLTGFLAGQTVPLDMLFGTAATVIACLLEAYASRFLFVAALWPVVINGLVVGWEVYWLFNLNNLPFMACVGWVALGELIALTVGYLFFMVFIRNKAFALSVRPTRHAEAKF